MIIDSRRSCCVIALYFRPLNSYFNGEILPDKEAANFSVDAKGDGVADPKDLSGEELRVVEESEVRFRDAITPHYQRQALQKYAPKLSNKIPLMAPLQWSQSAISTSVTI